MIIMIISFFLDGILSNLLTYSTYLYPLCSLLSLVIIAPYFKKRCIQKYFVYSAILGLLYDIVYTETLFLNMVLFFLIAVLIKLIYNLIKNTLLNTYIISLFIIICYRLSNYLIFLLIKYLSFNLKILFDSIINSLLLSFSYILIFFYLGRLIYKKSNEKKITLKEYKI